MFVVVMLLPTHFLYEWAWGMVAFVDKIVEIRLWLMVMKIYGVCGQKIDINTYLYMPNPILKKSVPNQVERQKWNTKRCILGTPPDPLILLGFSTKNPKSGTPFGRFLEHHLAVFWNTIWPSSGTPFGHFLEHHLPVFWNMLINLSN